ncbi:MAG: FAD-binding oxidoreductase [Propionibacterium sp.]|nr:FAD-binding oxidoreductase [Propionibacterium sp.]
MSAELDHRDLSAALTGAGIEDVRADTMTRALYSTDASLYRVLPRVVVMPHDASEVAATLATCRELGVPITARGAGTSCAGNAVGPGVVLDFSRHMNGIDRVDPESRTAVVQPGVVQAALMKAAAPHGLRFGPDPSSLSRCTIGGMIGNNACGNRALAFGRTSDNIVGLEVLTGTGHWLTATSGVDGRTASASGAETELGAVRELIGANLATVRTEFGRFTRQVSGYALEHLLPEQGFDMARMLVGSEGTLGIVTSATVRLIGDPPQTVLAVLGFDDIAAAGDVAHLLKPLGATAAEGIDRRIIDVMIERRGAHSVPELPGGDAWLFVEIPGETRAEAQAEAERVVARIGAPTSRIVTDPAEASALWKIRQDGAGLAGRSPRNLPAHAGWEDAAVPPEQLGNYLRDFDALLTAHNLTGLPYGHFGDGCLHIRLDFDLERPGGRGRYREFMLAAADLVARYGGSMSGEHGDGRARSELLPRMYSQNALALFAGIKHAFDPDNLLNPGVLVDPAATDVDLRVADSRFFAGELGYKYTRDGGDLAQALHRCTGVGKCRADGTSTTVMCPSYQATREEKDSTRGRARILQEVSNGGLIGSFGAAEVLEVLDLFLSCKGCASDCPTGIDMATYKSEALHQAYRGKLRPISHYSLGWLPRWTKLASRVPWLANAVLHLPVISSLFLRLAGVDPRRRIPTFADRTFRSWWKSHAPVGEGKPVVLFVDTFANAFTPDVARAAVRVLQAAGYAPVLTERQECCGLTWISTGQVDGAKRLMSRTVEALDEFASRGVPIVGLEPSCTAALRHDAVELLDTPQARRVAAATRTLAELLIADDDWRTPDLTGVDVVAQPHCHHHAVMGYTTDMALISDAGAKVERVGGCCGLAGNFGMEQGHYDISVAVAEQQLLPAVRKADDGTVVLADGFSCRTQLADLAERDGKHLAELLAERLD